MFIVWFCGGNGWFVHEYDTHEDAVDAACEVYDIGLLLVDGPYVRPPNIC